MLSISWISNSAALFLVLVVHSELKSITSDYPESHFCHELHPCRFHFIFSFLFSSPLKEPQPSVFLYKSLFCGLMRSPGDRIEWKMLVLYGCLQNSNSFDSTQSEVSWGTGTFTFMEVTAEAGVTANVSCPRRRTGTEVKKAGGISEAGWQVRKQWQYTSIRCVLQQDALSF